MPEFYKPDLGANSDDPFARDGDGKLVRRGYWLDMSDRSIVMVMTNGIGAHLPNEQKRLHLEDIGRGHLIDDVCIQEVLPPEEWSERTSSLATYSVWPFSLRRT